MTRRSWVLWMVCAVVLSLSADRDVRAALNQNFAGQTGLNTEGGLGGDVGPNHFVQVIQSDGVSCPAPFGSGVSAHSCVAIYQKTARCCTGPGDCTGNLCSVDHPCAAPSRCNWPKAFPMDWLAPTDEDVEVCRGSATSGADPTVLYDQFADRWLLAESNGGIYTCIYVSKTPNPATGWTADPNHPGYPSSASTTAMSANWTALRVKNVGEYPRFGLWPMSQECNNPRAPDEQHPDPNSYCGSYLGTAANSAFAINRHALVSPLSDWNSHWVWDNCTAPESPCQQFTVWGFPKPVDVDGTQAPREGEPAVFGLNFDGGPPPAEGQPQPPDGLLVWTLKVNWSAHSAEFSTDPSLVQTNSFNSELCGSVAGFYTSCIPQPAPGPLLRAYDGFPNDRLTYRYRGTNHQAIVGNFTVNAGNDRAAIRWFELRKGTSWLGCSARIPPGDHGDGWERCQEGTVAAGTSLRRWMGSAAMDGAGNIAVGYNVASLSDNPGLRYNGRLSSAAPGFMPAAECDLRLGDSYWHGDDWTLSSAMNIDPDPADNEQTFWFTGQYMDDPDHNHWSTAIGSFKFDGGLCPCPPTTSCGGGCSAANCGSWVDTGLTRCLNGSTPAVCSPGNTIQTQRCECQGAGCSGYRDTWSCKPHSGPPQQ